MGAGERVVGPSRSSASVYFGSTIWCGAPALSSNPKMTDMYRKGVRAWYYHFDGGGRRAVLGGRQTHRACPHPRWCRRGWGLAHFAGGASCRPLRGRMRQRLSGTARPVGVDRRRQTLLLRERVSYGEQCELAARRNQHRLLIEAGGKAGKEKHRCACLAVRMSLRSHMRRGSHSQAQTPRARRDWPVSEAHLSVAPQPHPSFNA